MAAYKFKHAVNTLKKLKKDSKDPFMRLQGKITNPLSKLYDSLVDNLRIPKFICPGKALAKSSTQKDLIGDQLELL